MLIFLYSKLELEQGTGMCLSCVACRMLYELFIFCKNKATVYRENMKSWEI